MMKRSLIVAVSMVATALAGCSDQPANTCTGELFFSAGALPPPHSYTWTINFESDTADYTLWSRAIQPDDPIYEALDIPITSSEAASLCHDLQGITTSPDAGEGGQAFSWDLVVDGANVSGRVVVTPEHEHLVEKAIHLIGQTHVDRAMAEREKIKEK